MGAPEAAKRLGLGLRQVYRLIDGGEIPAYLMGRLVRLKRADVETYARSMLFPPRTKTQQVRAYLHEHRGKWVAPAEVVEAVGCGRSLPPRVVTAMNAERPGSVEIAGGSSATRYRMVGRTI
jgi:excisionase family DNA binding protein